MGVTAVSWYAVVQFVPDIIAGERLNFAVLVYGPDDAPVLARITHDVDRIRAFGGAGVDVPQLVAVVRDLVRGGRAAILDACSWDHSVQVTRPCGSIQQPAELLDDIAGRLLREPGALV